MANKNLNKAPSETTILVTGGAGFIGSHTCVELLQDGYKVVVIDDLSNSKKEAIRRIKEIANADDSQFIFYENNLCDKNSLQNIFKENNVDAIIHFAGFKAVGESVEKPLEYYINNLYSTFNLCDCARSAGVKNLIFSSSATVYGDPQEIPITENCPKGVLTNPYGWSKSMQEQVFRDIYIGDNE